MKKLAMLAIMLLVVIVHFSTMTSFSSLSQSEVSEDDVTAIKATIEGYFDIRYSIESTLTMNEDIDKFFLLRNDKAQKFLNVEKEYLDLSIKHAKLQINDLRFGKYSYDLDYKNIAINNKTATVQLTENADIYFNFIPNIKSSMVGLKHEINLEKTDDGWFIIEDFYYDDLKNTVKQYMKDGKTLDEAKELILKDSVIK